MWALEPWSFKKGWVDATVPADGSTLSLSGLGLQTVEAVYSYEPNYFRQIASIHPTGALGTSATTVGRQEEFYVTGGDLYFDRRAVAEMDVSILGSLKWQKLVDDGDVPLIPEEYHYALVMGAAADMLLRESDPSWQGEEKGFNDQVAEMRIAYMGNQPMARTAYPSWPY
jgi:hypothetical protein